MTPGRGRLRHRRVAAPASGVSRPIHSCSSRSGFARPESRRAAARSDGAGDGDADGRPSVRMVLHRGFSRGGFVFYTNYNSRKAADLTRTLARQFVFHWPPLERQLRVEGRVQQIDAQRIGAVFPDASAREPLERVGVAAERRDCGTIVSRRGICTRAQRVSAMAGFRVRRSGADIGLSQIVSSSGRESRIACTIA